MSGWRELFYIGVMFLAMSALSLSFGQHTAMPLLVVANIWMAASAVIYKIKGRD